MSLQDFVFLSVCAFSVCRGKKGVRCASRSKGSGCGKGQQQHMSVGHHQNGVQFGYGLQGEACSSRWFMLSRFVQGYFWSGGRVTCRTQLMPCWPCFLIDTCYPNMKTFSTSCTFHTFGIPPFIHTWGFFLGTLPLIIHPWMISRVHPVLVYCTHYPYTFCSPHTVCHGYLCLCPVSCANCT